MLRVWSQINACAGTEGVPVSVGHACIAAAHSIGAFGAGLSMSRGDGLREPMFTTGGRSEEVSDLQFTLGEGPCLDALRTNDTILVADMASESNRRRWPGFAPAAARMGVGGLFSIPVRAGAVRMGVLDLYRGRPGPLTGEELADVLAYADALLVLALDRRVGISPGMGAFLDAEFTERRAEVHQATGMISVQLGVGMSEALARLRAHAYAHDRRLADVSADVVARRLQFHPERDGRTDARIHGGGANAAADGRVGAVGDPPGEQNNGSKDTGPLPGTDTTGEEGAE
ncbi:GAF and ANTAR domain-containing protein [Spirillospora sp. NPDC048911]|uniref:GAF and ANTAR domain-containing protein n=1 Tax=Spirillospora sp. NPDC048911 TaxID=3364527 RepID=UPI0037206F1C